MAYTEQYTRKSQIRSRDEMVNFGWQSKYVTMKSNSNLFGKIMLMMTPLLKHTHFEP
jgi:hypothetical protein